MNIFLLHFQTYFEDFPVGVIKRSGVPDRYCGKRKVLHTELIVNGYSTKPGDWPWHTAIYRQEKAALKYVCGGTLVHKHFVLTGICIIEIYCKFHYIKNYTHFDAIYLYI